MSTTSSTSSSLSLESQDNEIVTSVTIPTPTSNKQIPRKKTRSASVYRMASTFELGDDQVFKKNDKKENGRDFAATYEHLFGPPTPAAVRRMKNQKFYGDVVNNIRKSKKPLPVNPLTGHTIGDFKALSVSTPHLLSIREPRSKLKHSQLW